jgi:CYTH domain-containing protein
MTYAHKYARIESERKFLLNSLPSNFDINRPYKLFEDTYFPRTRLRLRKVTDEKGDLIEHKLTQKYREENQPSFETIITNIYLNENEISLMSKLSGNKIVKKRYSYLYNGSGFGIEIFEGKLQGLLLAEIEAGFQTLFSIDLPKFISEDVTNDSFFEGGYLSQIDAHKLNALLITKGISN